MENESVQQKQGLGSKVRSLFKLSDSQQNIQAVPVNSENIRQGETYIQWGTRMCGVVSGSKSALSPYLHKVYNHIYKEQANNVELQEQARKNTQAQIDTKKDENANDEKKICAKTEDINDFNEQIDELKAERQKLESGKEKVNKEQKLKLIIGLCVIVPLTMYLFLFYSSTFYSAFFKSTDSIENLMEALFDPQALSHASEMGNMAFMFVLCAPIIFLGLGFCLHFFSVQQGVGKYIKMAAMVGVTFAFDCILAYCIGHKFHEIGRITGAVDRDLDYSISLAVTDENIWVVIFCGFVVYIIWGIVFDMCMSAYNNMDLNKTRLLAIKDEITLIEDKKKFVKGEIEALRNHIAENKKIITDLMTKLGREVYIDYAAIRTEMNNFFAGWVTQMQILSMSQTDQDEATAIFNSTIGDLLKGK